MEEEHQTETDTVKSRFIKVGTLLKEQMTIPPYQRPYVWTHVHVEQLLSDILAARDKRHASYLIGSVILHENPDTERLDIVDGQQRITTICLILKALNAKCSMPELKFAHTDSISHIRENFNYITTWRDQNLGEADYRSFSYYLQRKCMLVEIKVKRLAEAFQLFETQNGRGKPLEAYNLLKAYHLRAMPDEAESSKRECDIRWEAAASFTDVQNRHTDLLRTIINEHLYRTRLWSRGYDAGRFSKNDIDEFKGLTVGNDDAIKFPYQNIILLQLAKDLQYKTKPRFNTGDPDNVDPFSSINQPIINGNPFFDYVETYVEIYKRMFLETDQPLLPDFHKFYRKYCKEYPGAHRTGDGYIRQMFKSAVMLVIDRFGEEGLMQTYRDLYAVIYSTRLHKRQVRYSTMTRQESGGRIFRLITHAKTIADLRELRQEANAVRDNLPADDKLFNAPVVKEGICTPLC